MIVLDTNVVSELMKPVPDAAVARWTAGQAATTLHTTSVTLAEIMFGVMLLPTGKRRNSLEAAAQAMFSQDFGGRILPFGIEAAHAYTRIAVQRRRAGRPISQFDAQIAAIASASRACVATRNVNDYEGCGIKVLNPWDA